MKSIFKKFSQAVLVLGLGVAVGAASTHVARADDDAPAQANDNRQGTSEGVLTGKGNGFILVRADGDHESTRIYPRWVGGTPQQGGGLDKRMLAIFQQLVVGSRLKVSWIRDNEHVRAVDIQVLPAQADNGAANNGDAGNGNDNADNGNANNGDAANADNGNGNAENENNGNNGNDNADDGNHPFDNADKGVFEGVLSNKGIDWVSFRPDGERESTRFMPRWVGGTKAQGGGLDKDVLRAIDQIKVGSRVHVEWLRTDDGLRVSSLRSASSKPQDTPQQ